MSKREVIGLVVVVFLFAVFLFVWSPQSPDQVSKKEIQEAVNSMVFVKEPTTGLCFGVPTIYHGYKSFNATNVPCDKVGAKLSK